MLCLIFTVICAIFILDKMYWRGKMSTIKDVAALAGVSVTTVSRIINRKGSISEETTQKVKQAMENLNYYPNEVARSLQNKSRHLIGFIVPYIDHPFFSKLAAAVEDACYKKGYKLLLCTSWSSEKKEKEVLSMLRANQVDGILICSRIGNVSAYRDITLPLVSIERTIEGIPSVACDNYKGGVLAAQALIAGGCKHPVLFGNKVSKYLPAYLRHQGFHDECKCRGIKSSEYLIEKEDIFASRLHYNVNELIRQNLNLDGIFATSDVLAAGVTMECRALGRKIPDQIQVVGFDGVTISENCSISTVAQPISDMGEFAVTLLINKINGGLVPEKSILPVSLIHRNTTMDNA